MATSFEHGSVDLLRLTTAGSVDDGKSTLIGRLLYDSGNVFGDQLAAIQEASKGRGNGEIDFSLLTDGLAAEREQGITIDVAYRYFSTEKRRFIIADVPGHEQYTRNMVTGASTSNVAMILVDARKGVQVQSKRHLFIASLLGIPHILVVVNKMDLVDYSEEVFSTIKHDLTDFAAKLNLKEMQFVPISALAGDMVVHRQENMEWYEGTTVLNYLEQVPITSDENLQDFRFPVQTVLRPNQDERWYAGRIEGGIVRVGDAVRVHPSGHESVVTGITIAGQSAEEAFCPQSAAISLKDELDMSRGDVLARTKNSPETASKIEASLCWMAEEPLKEEAELWIKHGTKTIGCTLESIRYEIDVNTLRRQEEVRELALNSVGRVELVLHEPIQFDPYEKNRNTGSFILINPAQNGTVAAGMIVRGQKEEKSIRTVKAAPVLWLYGLSGSGKSTIAEELSKRWNERGIQHECLDGDVLRELFGNDLGFSKEDRTKQITRAAQIAHLLQRNGVSVIASFITPYQEQRELAKKIIGEEAFTDVFVDTPLEECEKRDVKGLYAKARAGEIESFTGISDPFEVPDAPKMRIETLDTTPEASAQQILEQL